MSETLILHEQRPVQVDLEANDIRYLSTEFKQQFTLQRDILDDRLRINPNQFVGVLTLPSGRRIEIKPKVPISNLFKMLAVAYRLPWTFRSEQAEFKRLDELLNFLATYFVDLVETRLRTGLYRAYTEATANLTSVRGRIVFAEDVRRNAFQRHRTYCSFSHFTWDVPENQIIRQVVWMLRGWHFPTNTRKRLSQLDARLADISVTDHTASICDSFQYGRFNADYEPIHQLCRLFLDGASVSETSGQHAFRTFLIDMNRLFETFVAQILQDRTPRRFLVVVQSRSYFDMDARVRLRPDVVVSLDGDPALIVDCKYKKVAGGAAAPTDLYQMLAYCTAIGVRRSMLVYPDHEHPADVIINVRGSRSLILQRVLSLTGEPSAFERTCKHFSDAVFTAAACSSWPEWSA